MSTIQTIKQTSLEELMKKTAPKTASADMTQQVAEAIKAAGQKTTEQQIQDVKESSERTGKKLREETEKFQAEQTAALPQEPQQEDGLQRMIREAQIQTDASMKGVVGSDPAVQDAGLKLRQIYTGTPSSVPMSGQTENDKEEWEDLSYLTPQTELKQQGQKMQGGFVDEKAGTYMQRQMPDGSYQQEPFIYQQDGRASHVGDMTEEQIRQLIQQSQDDSFALTGRVYKPNADGSVPQWLSVGDRVVTAGGTYVITGYDREKGSGYHSMLLDPNQTTDNFQGNYNTGTYGSILGTQNGNADSFKGFRDSNGEYTGYGGYSVNQKTGQTQFDTVAHTFDGEWTRSAVIDGVPYKLGARGELEPLEAGSLIQDASERYWVIGADGVPIDVTPADPRNNPLNDPTGEVGRIQREEAQKAGLNLYRNEKSTVDPVVEAQIAQLEAQLAQERAAVEAANRDLYRQYRQGQENLNDQLVSAGLATTGATEKAHADLTAEYLAAANANRAGVRSAENDAAYEIEMARLQAAQNRQAEQQQQAQQKAAILAQYGDFSGYGDLGYTPAQIAGMEAAYARENAVDNTYGGLSDYAATLLDVYRANPKYDIQAGLQQALQNGLISQQDYLAGLQMAGGLAV